jgi:uncharacterized protein (TIGR02246 family)
LKVASRDDQHGVAPSETAWEPNDDDVRAEIALGNQRCADALKRGDADAYAANFADDSLSLPGLGPIVRGRDSIRVAMLDSFRSVRFDEAETTPSDLRAFGDVAFEAGQYRFVVTNGNGRPQVLTGRYLVIWRREQGAWRIAVDAAQPGAPLG